MWLWLMLTWMTATTDEAVPAAQAETLGPGDHTRTLTVQGLQRTYHLHIPRNYDPLQPAPVVLALHGAGMNGSLMSLFCGLDQTAEREGFVVVYPNGTGNGPFLSWNAGGLPKKLLEGRPDDVAFINHLLDDLARVVKVDEKRIYACGMSNGAMMCYRLAAELSHRIAAIAPVAGTLAVDECQPRRPVPVIHFHGTKDQIVPFEMSPAKAPPFLKLKSVEESIQTWVQLNGCEEQCQTEVLTKVGAEMRVTRRVYRGGRDGSEVVLVVIEGGGHTWPGQRPLVGFIGDSTLNISANDLMWEFFQRHQLP